MNPFTSAFPVAAQQASPRQARIQQLQQVLRQEPGNAKAAIELAQLYFAEGRVRPATQALLQTLQAARQGLSFGPGFMHALAQYGEFTALRELLNNIDASRLQSPHALLELALVEYKLARNDCVLSLLDAAKEKGLSTALLHYQHALQLTFRGDVQAAIASYRNAMALEPTNGRIHYGLSRLYKPTAEDNNLAFIDAQLANSDLTADNRGGFLMSRHEELHKLGDTEGAWLALQAGNDCLAEEYKYDPAAQKRLFDEYLRVELTLPPVPKMVAGSTKAIPVFILGMPRSGSTLLDRLLGAHPDVASAGELSDFEMQFRWTADRASVGMLDYPLINAMTRLDYKLLGKRYLEQTNWRASGKKFFIDKLPSNFLLAGIIARALPQARILHTVRDPMDVCFSNYRAMFSTTYASTYSLERIASHYKQYRRVMDHWHATMPGRILDVNHDELVNDPEGTMRKVLNYCGLPYDPKCIDPDANDRLTTTLSTSQVRGGIKRDLGGAWRRYEKHLGPLIDSLADYL